jgi:hypothetical protein
MGVIDSNLDTGIRLHHYCCSPLAYVLPMPTLSLASFVTTVRWASVAAAALRSASPRKSAMTSPSSPPACAASRSMRDSRIWRWRHSSHSPWDSSSMSCSWRSDPCSWPHHRCAQRLHRVRNHILTPWHVDPVALPQRLERCVARLHGDRCRRACGAHQ